MGLVLHRECAQLAGADTKATTCAMQIRSARPSGQRELPWSKTTAKESGGILFFHKGHAHSRRHHPDWAARPALTRPGGTRRQRHDMPGLRCGTRLARHASPQLPSPKAVSAAPKRQLPLSRFESRAVCVAVFCLRAGVEGATPNIRWK